MIITEGQLRSIISQIIAEASPPRGFKNPQVHSMGWIDPEGDYHYDPDFPDHSEWAGMVAIPNIPGAIEELAQRIEAPPGEDLEWLVYSSGSRGEKEIRNMLLERGWVKVSNAYTVEVWEPTRTILNSWLDLGMEADCDPEREFLVVGRGNKPLVRGDWHAIERYVKGLPG